MKPSLIIIMLVIFQANSLKFKKFTLIKNRVESKKLKYSEEIHIGDYNYDRIIDIYEDDKVYKLCLNENINSFSTDIVSNILLDDIKIYNGIICGKSTSMVQGTIINNIFHGEIIDENGIHFYLEDLVKFKEIKENCTDCHTIMYRHDDIELTEEEKKSVKCGNSHNIFTETNETTDYNTQNPNELNYQPLKQSNQRNVEKYCDLAILMHKSYTDSFISPTSALGQIATHIETLNQRLNDQIKTENPESELQYSISLVNYIEDLPGVNFNNPEILLETIRMLSNTYSICAIGLYVNKNWGTTLGLATVGTASGVGICNYAANYVITIQLDNSIIPFPMHKVTTIHEIGHNLGSKHDPTANCDGCDTSRISECSPSDNFIMAAFANEGVTYNNLHYSQCSVDVIKSLVTLSTRRGCLKAKKSIVCGNGIVEKGEECDSGLSTTDKCCGSPSSNYPCKIKGECSPSNGECCEKNTCKFSQSGKICRESTKCTNAASCSGTSAKCEAAVIINENKSCDDENRALCFQGTCSKLPCSLYNKTDCECDGKMSCKICCKDSINDTQCLPLKYPDMSEKNKIEGFTCKIDSGKGYCDSTSTCKALNFLSPTLNIFALLISGELFTKIARFFLDYLELMFIGIACLLMIFSILSRLFNVEHKKLYDNMVRRRTMAAATYVLPDVTKKNNDDALV